MSTTVNEKGVFTKKITISRHGKSESVNTLSNIFIKHTDKYSVKATNFVTNVVPPLWRGTKTLFKIREKDAQNQVVVPEWAIYPFTEYGDCVLSNVFGIPQLITDIWDFFDKFNLLARGSELVVNYANTPLNTLDIDNYYVNNPQFTDQLYCSFGTDTSGKVTLKLSKKFLTEFYVIVDPEIAKLLGLSELIWASTLANGNMVTSEDDQLLYDDLGAGNVFLHNEQVEMDAGPKGKNIF